MMTRRVTYLLLQVLASELDFVGNCAAIDPNLHDVRFLLSVIHQTHLQVSSF